MDDIMEMKLQPGQKFEGYEVVDEIDSGSTSIVYKIKKEEPFALKLFTGSVNSDYRDRFVREAEYLCKFSHQNIIKGIEHGCVKNTGRPYLIMDFFDGHTLNRFYALNKGLDGNLEVSIAIEILRQLISALNYIKKNFSLIHRDLKLENVLIAKEITQCKLIDFGLAKNLNDKLKLPSSWELNAAPRYRSPEKWVDFHATDEKSDVWSLGIILYYIITGAFPFSIPHATGSEKMLMDRVLHERPIPPSHKNSSLPDYLDTIIDIMLTKNASMRPNLSELEIILTPDEAKFYKSIDNTYRNRAKVLKQKLTELYEGLLNQWTVDYISILYEEENREKFVNLLKSTRKNIFDIFMKAEVKWGPFLSSKAPKVANTCEVLLTIDNFILETVDLNDIIEKVFWWLIDQEEEDGFPSLSLNLVTTQCTALAAMAFYHISQLHPLKQNVRKKSYEASIRTCNKLIGLSSKRGWGSWKNSSIRIYPMIWALRALSRHFKLFEKKILLLFDQLRAIHTVTQPGVFGFRPGTEGHVSPTACFLLLCSDLESVGYIEKSKIRYKLEKYNALKFLINDPRRNEFWSSEQEVYYVDHDIIPLLGGIEQLSWNHISGPLSIEGIGGNLNLLGLSEDTIIWFLTAVELNERIRSTGLFNDPKLVSAGKKDAIFPSTYASMALKTTELWLESFEKMPKYPVTPPKPEFTGKTICKIGAAIISEGKILLVRKYGTDQMIMPGGGLEEGESPIETLIREVREELGVGLRLPETVPIGIYKAPAAFEKDMQVEITLFWAELKDIPNPSGEIEELIWYKPGDQHVKLSQIVKEQIIPSLIKKGHITK